MNLKHRLPIIAFVVTSILCIAISLFSLKSGQFIIFQNLFYIPIIISCFYYKKQGLAISVALSLIYFFLIIAFTSDPMIIWGALVRAILFILIAAVITALIIAREQTEAALKKEREKFQILVETTRDLIYTTDKKGFLTYMNPTLEKTLGYTHDEWSGKNFGQIVAPEYIDSVRDLFIRAMQGESIPVYEVDLTRKNGSRFSVEFNVSTIYDNEGKPAGRYGIGRDITDRKRALEALRESEEKYRDIFNGALEGIYQTSPQGQSLSANPAMASMLGYDSADELVASITDAAHQVWANPNERSHFTRLLEEHGAVYGYECQFLRKDKTNPSSWFLSKKRVVFAVSENVYLIILTC